jgi:4-hydroxymandelate oxidase
MNSEFNPACIADFEPVARANLSQMAYDYFSSGAEDEVTLRDNMAAFDRIRLRPRMLRGVSERDLSVTVLGQKLATPIGISPMAFMKLAHPDGESAVARAAASRGMVMTLSTMSTTSMEDVIAAHAEYTASGAAQEGGAYRDQHPSPMWFQLYVYRDREITRGLVERAEAAGYRALVVTVDTPFLGKRLKDVRNRFALPEGLTLANLNRPDSARVGQVVQDSGLAAYIVSRYDSGLTWESVEWLRSITKLPVIVKGVLRGDDAALAVQHGASGIIVSNHGGRQLDSAVATIDALAEVVEGANGGAEVMIDGGVRRGTDVLKALALGAKLVLVGRPVMWGLAVGGERSVKQVLDLLRDELDLAMALSGVKNIAEITMDLLAKR